MSHRILSNLPRYSLCVSLCPYFQIIDELSSWSYTNLLLSTQYYLPVFVFFFRITINGLSPNDVYNSVLEDDVEKIVSNYSNRYTASNFTWLALQEIRPRTNIYVIGTLVLFLGVLKYQLFPYMYIVFRRCETCIHQYKKKSSNPFWPKTLGSFGNSRIFKSLSSLHFRITQNTSSGTQNGRLGGRERDSISKSRGSSNKRWRSGR